MNYKKRFIVVLLLIVNLTLYSQNENIDYLKKVGFKMISLKTKNDTIRFITSSVNENKSKPTILFIQGSLPLPIIFYDEKTTNTILPFDIKQYLDKFNFIIIARKGVPLIGSYEKDIHGYKNENGKFTDLYLKNDNLKYRTFQAKKVLIYLYRQDWVKKDSIFVIGHSEGYRIAAKLSENNKKISKLVCMSANPFNRISEEIFRERIKCLSSDNDSIHQSNIYKFIKDYKSLDSNIEIYKQDSELYNWASYNGNDFAFKSLLKFYNPILVTYGTEDIGSLQNDLLPFLLQDKKISLKAYPNLDHNYFKKEYDHNGIRIQDSYHWDDVFRDIAEWLLSIEKLD